MTDDEISRLIAAVATTEPQYVKELVQLKTTLPNADGKKLADRDELYESAIDIVVREGRGSVSLLQRALGIGYGRAARLVDFMAEDGIVGPYNGSQAREILMTLEQWETMTGQSSGESAAAPPKPQRNNKILLASPDEEEAGQSLPGKIRTVKPVAAVDDDEELEDKVDEEDEEAPFDVDSEEADEEEEPSDEEESDEDDIEDGEDDSVEDEAEEEIEDEADDAEPEEEEAPKPAKNFSKRRWKAESA